MDWTRLRTSCRTYAGIGPDTARPLPGRLRDTTRLLPGLFSGCCADDSADIAADVAADVAPDATPDATPDAARKLRGRCSSCGLIF